LPVIDSLTDSARAALTSRLNERLSQRIEAFRESAAIGGTGDAADRAGNVEAIIRLEDLDSRIAGLREQLAAPAAVDRGDDSVQVGSSVGVRFDAGEQPETFLIGVLEQSSGDVGVITPASPLGGALLGARAGDSVTYRAASGATLTVELVTVSG
jgi:transcription elongation factor GreA